MSIADRNVVRNQYADSSRLEARISIHEKYSRSKQPFGAWITSHYDFKPGEHVLELGCGTGSMWLGVTLPEGCHVTLTDLSPGMLETTRRNTPHLRADYAVCDAMSLPYASGSFDVIIANMMLYHVPDIDLALREIRRVLKRDGRFYAATSGEHGAVEAVLSMLSLPSTVNHRFTLQNGSFQLARHFGEIAVLRREDALEITHLPDLIAYLRTMQGMTALADLPDDELLSVFSAHVKDGVLTLPKEYGMFVCRGFAGNESAPMR